MLSAIAAVAATAAIASGPAFGMAASPAAYDHATTHHTYTVLVTNLGSQPERVRAALTAATRGTAGSCELSGSPTWARLAGPSSFRLRPHGSRTVLIHIGSAPAGRSELVAAFVASQPHGKGEVATSGGVGTALRFSQPGHTARAARPCVASARPPATSSAALPLEAGGTSASLLLLVAGFIVLRNRRRHTTT